MPQIVLMLIYVGMIFIIGVLAGVIIDKKICEKNIHYMAELMNEAHLKLCEDICSLAKEIEELRGGDR